MIPDLRTQAGPHVFVESLASPMLSDDDRHHLAKSLRVRPGDPLTLSDGAGSWRTARFGEPLEVSGEIVTPPAPAYELGLAVALTKSSKPEFAVQKATELGIDVVVLFGADHSVAKWDDAKAAKQLLRLNRVAREAAMQSHRVTIPAVEIVADLDTVIQTWATGLARADFGGEQVAEHARMIAIGPEGGWSERERRALPAAVELGPHVLRAETAAVVASSQLVTSRSYSRG